jgi:serine/threonine protein phosphatase PrpC
MRVIGAGWTDIGLQRDTNEDSFAVVQEGKEVERQGACYVVCDGLSTNRGIQRNVRILS